MATKKKSKTSNEEHTARASQEESVAQVMNRGRVKQLADRYDRVREPTPTFADFEREERARGRR
jgi:hypothetical protein